ncbi:MAG: hypothetical protein ACOYBY_04605 [Dermatophilaceae bacterium]
MSGLLSQGCAVCRLMLMTVFSISASNVKTAMVVHFTQQYHRVTVVFSVPFIGVAPELGRPDGHQGPADALPVRGRVTRACQGVCRHTRRPAKAAIRW